MDIGLSIRNSNINKQIEQLNTYYLPLEWLVILL